MYSWLLINFTSYINLLLFFSCAFIFGILLYLLNFIIYSLKAQRYFNRHTFKTYEFGTTTIGNAQTLSNSHFFLLSALFIIFDVEIFFMYIWVSGLTTTSTLLYKLSFLGFVNLLVIGIIYELLNGVLNWYKKKL